MTLRMNIQIPSELRYPMARHKKLPDTLIKIDGFATNIQAPAGAWYSTYKTIGEKLVNTVPYLARAAATSTTKPIFLDIDTRERVDVDEHGILQSPPKTGEFIFVYNEVEYIVEWSPIHM